MVGKFTTSIVIILTALKKIASSYAEQQHKDIMSEYVLILSLSNLLRNEGKSTPCEISHFSELQRTEDHLSANHESLTETDVSRTV